MKNPNIILVLIDDLGYGDVSCFNPQSKIPTPNLERLAQQGRRFTDCHASSAVCSPSRYALMTGRYNWRSRLKRTVLAGTAPHLIEDGRLTIAELLRRAGRRRGQMAPGHGLAEDRPRHCAQRRRVQQGLPPARLGAGL